MLQRFHETVFENESDLLVCQTDLPNVSQHLIPNDYRIMNLEISLDRSIAAGGESPCTTYNLSRCLASAEKYINFRIPFDSFYAMDRTPTFAS